MTSQKRILNEEGYEELLNSQARVCRVSDIIVTIPSQFMSRSAASRHRLLSRKRMCQNIETETVDFDFIQRTKRFGYQTAFLSLAHI